MKDVLPTFKTHHILVVKLCLFNTTHALGVQQRPFCKRLLHCKCAKTFLLYRFKGCPVIAVAAKPGGPEAPDTEEAQGITELIEVS